ncbi:MAG TPA: hypothetical protein VL135_01745 [Terracidiphilus sp.]|jgi:hypothetical protein|nr:hypothetical protein [Terracidiphilus sp.]
MERPNGTARRWGSVLISLSALILTTCGLHLAAQDLAVTDLPSAPVPVVRSGIATRSAATPVKQHRWLTLNNASVSFLFIGEALDSWTTYRNLTHPKWICGYSSAFGNAVTYISNDGERYDQRTIQRELCGPGPSGQLANYAYDVTRTGAFTETGWVTNLRLTSNRNVAGVLAWNIADDIGQVLIVRYLAKRSRLIGRIAPGMNFGRGIIHLDCGIQNLKFAQKHANAGAWQFQLPNESTLYPGPRWWGER